MKNRRWITVMLCGTLLLGGCGNQNTDGKGQNHQIKAEGNHQSNGVADEGTGQTNTENEDMDVLSADAGDGGVVIEAGPDKKLYDTGSLIYTLHDFRLYDTAEDASVEPEEKVMIDAKDYADQSKFLLMQADIHNIDYQGYENDGSGEMNLSMFMIKPKDQDDSQEWAGSYPVYLSEAGQGETDYYHVFVKPGETKTITVGFYVPVSDGEELRSRCRISISGSMDEGYVYEIPEVQ